MTLIVSLPMVDRSESVEMGGDIRGDIAELLAQIESALKRARPLIDPTLTIAPTPVVRGEDGSERTWTGEGVVLKVRDRVHPNHDLVVRTVEISSADYRREIRQAGRLRS